MVKSIFSITVLAFTAFFGPLATQGANLYWWPAADGSFDGSWGDASHWSKNPVSWDAGAVPTDDDSVVFPSPSEPYTVNFPAEGATATAITISSPASGSGEHCVRFAGSDNVFLSDYFTVDKGACVILDGPQFSFAENGYCNLKGRMELRSGAFNMPGSSNLYMLNSSAEYFYDRPFLVVSGGNLTVNRLKMSESQLAVYRQTSGFVRVNNFEVLRAADGKTLIQSVELLGGTLHRNQTWSVSGDVFVRGSSTNVFTSLEVYGIVPAHTRYYGDCIALEQYLYTYWAEGSVGKRALIDYPHGITYGSIGNWRVDRYPDSIIYERFWIDTADLYEPSTRYSISYNSWLQENRGDFRVYGGGSLLFYPPERCPQKMDSMSIGAGTTLDCRRSGSAAGDLRTRFYVTENLTLEPGARYYGDVSFNNIEVSETPNVGDGAEIVFTCHDGVALTAGYPYFLTAAGVRDAASKLPVRVENPPAGWDLIRLANCTFLYDGKGLAKDTTKATEWCGGTDGYLSTPSNWSSGVMPNLTSGGNAIDFYTLQGDITNDVDNLMVSRIRDDGKLPNFPVRLSGKPVKLTDTGSQRGSRAAVYWMSDFPLIFNCDVASTSATFFNVLAGYGAPTCTYVAFLKKLDVPCTFDVSGHVLIGGEATVKDIWMERASSARKSLVEVMRGGSLTVTNQMSVASRDNSPDLGYRIDEGGTMSFTGGTGLHGNLATEHSVNGTLSIGIPLSADAKMGFYGKGRLNVASVRSGATAATIEVGERLRVYPASWTTVTEDGEGPITLALRTRATLGATKDWTYGVASGVTTATTPAQRALVVADHETLTVDTQSPDDGLGYTVTFADPIVAPGGYLVKKGAGTLVLASADNDLATSEVTVEGGALTWTEPQTFGKFAVKPGAELLVDAQGDALLTLDLGAQDLDVEGVGIALTEDAQDVAGMSWTTVATVGEGHAIVGTPVAGEGWKTRVVTLAAGGQALQCKKRGGSMMIIR